MCVTDPPSHGAHSVPVYVIRRRGMVFASITGQTMTRLNDTLHSKQENHKFGSHRPSGRKEFISFSAFLPFFVTFRYVVTYVVVL